MRKVLVEMLKIVIKRAEVPDSNVGLFAHMSISTKTHEYIVPTYADFPNNNFDLPKLDYLRIWASTKTHGYILRTFSDIPNNEFGLPTLDYLRT